MAQLSRPDQEIEIVDGPGKFDLMLALFDNDNDHRHLVDLTLRSLGDRPPLWFVGGIVKAGITSVGRGG